MAKQIINIGTSANKGDGDPLRVAFDKINDNFEEVYSLIGGGGDIDDVVAPMLVHGQHKNVTVTRDDDANLIIFSVDQVVTDLKGSLAGDDSTILVNGVNSSINLDGTVKGDIVPDTDVAYDLGSATKRFRDLYLSGSSIDLGGTTLSVVGGELLLGGVKVPTTADPVQTSTITGVTDIVSGASPDQYMYLSTTSGETTHTNIALKYSSVYTGPINELMGATVIEELKVGNTIEIAYAPTILASINPGTSSRIDMDIIAGVDNSDGPVRGQINIGENNTEVINIGTTGIASAINIGDTFSPSNTTTTIGGNIDLSNATLYNRMSIVDLGDGQTTFRTTETNQDGDTLASVWLQSLTASGMQVINDPAGDSNTLYSTVEVEASSATLTSAVQTLAGDEFGRVLVAPGFIQLRAGTPADGTQVWQLNSDGTIQFPDSTLQSTAWTGNAPGLTYTDLLGNTEIGVTANVFDFGTNTTIDMQNCSVLLSGATVSGLDSLRSEGDITIDINLSDSTLRTWKFTEGGQFETAGSIIANGSLRFPGVGTISGDSVVPSLDLEVAEFGDIALLSGNYAWKFGGDGTLTVPGNGKIASPDTGNLEFDVGRDNGGAFIVTAWADKNDPEGGWKQILWGYDGSNYEFFVGGDVAAQGNVKGQEIKVGPAGTAAPVLSTTVSEQNGLAMDLRIDAGTNGGVTGNVTIAGDSIELLAPVNTDAINIGATRIREEFIEFQGASQLSIPLDGWRSQFAIDIVNKEVVVTSAENGSGQDVLIVQPGSVIFTTDYYFIDNGTYYQVTGVTDLGGGLTQLDIPGYDFTSLIGPVPVELFDSTTNTDPHEVRIDSGGDATGIRSLTGVSNITGQDDQYLYLSTSLSAGATSSNIAMTSVGGVKNTLNGTTDFGSGATVDFTNATVTNWTDPNVVNEHSGGAIIVVAGQTATMDDLTVRITENTPGEIDVEFNYDPSSGTVAVSANGDLANRFNGTTTLSAGNTTWTTMNVLTTVGDKGEFTIVDHSYHKIYRVTTFARALPGSVDAGDAYCIIERLK